MRLFAPALLTTLILGGCATTFEPKLPPEPTAGFDLVDMSRVDVPHYTADYAACIAIANQDNIDAKRVASGALDAAADRLSLGVLGNRPAHFADRMSVVKRCLEGRGYKILR